VIPFKSPASYTGEDVVEYHLHGGRAVIDSVLAALSRQPSHRMAEPGEFTRRAFENGKMDLTAAEAVADLIDAETQAQRIQALGQMGGALSALYNDWTERLKKILAHIEADIEFPDEDLPEGLAPEVVTAVQKLSAEIQEHLSDNRRGERLRDGIQVAVIGAPNAGKSSLVNALVQREVAIVSPTAGTTRDVIEAHLDIGGYPVIIVDTAGLRPRPDWG
jgi:tRNA modification GTPase